MRNIINVTKRYGEVTCMHLSLSSLMGEVGVLGATEHCQRIIFVKILTLGPEYGIGSNSSEISPV